MNLLDIVPEVMEPKLSPALAAYQSDRMPEFKRVLESHPLKDPIGGISVCEAFWLYNLVKDISPGLVIESGTLYGYSLWFLHEAIEPKPLRLYSFDPGYEPKYKLGDVIYLKKDWTAFENVPENTFVFFDDHQDQGQRLNEALQRGVRDIVFHDNYLSLKHSHRPIRYCALPDRVEFSFTFPVLWNDPIFEPGVNAQTYRWLTWLRLGA